MNYGMYVEQLTSWSFFDEKINDQIAGGSFDENGHCC
jgi:hypothetical protein